MIIHQYCVNEIYTVHFYRAYILIVINNIPKDNYNLDKLYYDLEPYFMIDNTMMKYKGKLFHNPKQLKSFFNIMKNRLLPLYNKNM